MKAFISYLVSYPSKQRKRNEWIKENRHVNNYLNKEYKHRNIDLMSYLYND